MLSIIIVTIHWPPYSAGIYQYIIVILYVTVFYKLQSSTNMNDWIPVRSTCTKHDHNKLILLFIHCIVNWWTDYHNNYYFEDSFIIIYLQQFRLLFSFSENDKEEALITVITSHIVLEEERVPGCLENNYYFPLLIFVKEKK